jgi:hypothetical protein
MRRPSLVVPVVLAIAYVPLTLAAQHPAAAPAVPAPAVHFAPAHPAGSSGAAHSPSTHATSHVAMRTPTHGSTKSLALLPPSKVSSGAGSGSGNGNNNGSVYVPTYSSSLPSGPVLLPGGAFSGFCSPLNCSPAPGLGFDYTHFFATHPDWGRGIRTAGVVVPFGGGGGFYLPIPYYVPDAEPEEDQAAPPDENANYNNEQNQDGNSDNNRQMVPQRQSAPAASQDYYPPSEPVYDYVFVKRDGTKIFAVAYSLTKDKLSYVTHEGLRRTLSLDDLDFAATQKSNEERGNTITLPTPPPAAMAAL